MDDDNDSGEGQQAPNELGEARRRRIPKLSGVAREAVGDLAFTLYCCSESGRVDGLKLREGMARWKARWM